MEHPVIENNNNIVPKADIKWFELFFDILIVLGISKVVHNIGEHVLELNFIIIIQALVVVLILLNTWTRVLMFENKIKVIERHIDEEIYGYQLPIMGQFFIIFCIIFIFNIGITENLTEFLLAYFLLTVTNVYLYNVKKYKVLLTFLFFIISFLPISNDIIYSLFFIYVLLESISTYCNLEQLSNSIFRVSSFKPKISVEFHGPNKIGIPKFHFYNKVYIPHITERVGIVMIVFMAEYVLSMFNTLENIDHPLIIAFLCMALLLMFYMDFFSIIEHYDKELLKIVDKPKRYQKTKNTLYLTFIYFISIIGLNLFLLNLDQHHVIEVEIIGLASYMLFEFTNISILYSFKDFKPRCFKKYFILKSIGFIVIFSVFNYANNFYFLLALCFSFAINVYVSRFTKIEYRFK